jgi:CUB/sushi domain-containing protein
MWSETEPTCVVRRECSEPELEHGIVEVSSNRIPYVIYRCERGYEHRGSLRQNCDLITGRWDGSPPTCEKLIDCGHPGNITNGAVTVSQGTHEGTYARYMCDDRYLLNGTYSRRCGSDGRWGGTEPTCEVQRECPEPELEHGIVEVSSNRIPYVIYRCERGYEHRGSLRQNCDLITGVEVVQYNTAIR